MCGTFAISSHIIFHLLHDSVACNHYFLRCHYESLNFLPGVACTVVMIKLYTAESTYHLPSVCRRIHNFQQFSLLHQYLNLLAQPMCWYTCDPSLSHVH